MLQPKKDNFKLNQADQALLEKEMIAYAEEGATDDDLIEFKNTYIAEKKKTTPKFDSTAQNQKSASETNIGSLDGVGSNGFPAIDQNLGVPGLKPDLKTVDQLANPPKSKVTIQEKTTNKEDVKGFGEGLLNRLDTGIATFSKSFYDAPKMILDAVYAPQNYLSEKLNIPSLKVDPETYAFENIPSKNMDEIVNSNNKKIENYKKEIGGDVVSTFDKGDYVNTFKHAALNSMESAPLIAAAMATGGESLLANSIMIGSSASTQYDQLTKEHPEMETRTKLANAAVNGALEVAVGKFMEGVGGNVWKNVLANKGVKETAQIATNSFKKTLEKVVGDSPMVGVAGGYAEERITDGLQQLNDIATGASTEFNWDQNKNAGLSSLGFGLPNATALYSAKAYISNKTRKRVTETSKQIVKLQNDLQNPELSPENKKIISENISKIYDENKKILGDELEKLKIIPEKTKGELLSIDKNIDKIKDNAIDIKYDVNISEENKTLLLKKLEQDFKDNINRKNEILSKTSEVEFLPLKEQDKLKRQALKELTAELNPDGTKNIEIDNAQITERANKIYSKQLKDAEAKTTTTETQPQAEVPKQSENKKVIIPDEIKDEHSRALEGHQESIADLEKKLAEEKALPWLKRDKQEQKWIEEDIKFHKESAKMLEENPVQYYKDFLKSEKASHENRLKEGSEDGYGKTYKDLMIERFGSTDFETTNSRFIEDINSKIAKLEDANKPQAEVPQQAEADKVAEFDDIEEMFPRNRPSSSEFRSHQGERFEISLKPIDVNDIEKGYTVNVSTSLKDGRYVFSDALSGEFATKKEAEEYAMEFVKKDKKTEALKTKETPKPQEVSPVEDVVATSVVEGETKKINGKELTFYKLEGDNTDSGFAVEKNKDGYVIQSALLPFSKQKQGIGTDFYVRINNESIEKTGSPLKSSENLSNSGGKPFWEKLVDKGLAEKTEDGFKFKEQTKVTNETAPSQDSTIDGNVRLGASNVGESGITKQQSSPKESVPSTVDGGEVKGDVEVDLNLDDVSNFLNEQFGAKKLVEVKETPKPKKEVTPKQDKVEQAKGFVTMAVGNLTTSLKDFQGRAKEFSEDTYNRIVNEAKEGALNISAIPPIQIWKSPDTGKFVILAGHSRTKAFSDLASGEIEFSDKYKKTDFEKVNTQIVEAKTLEEAQKIAQESNQGSVQTVVDNAKYVRESLLSTFKNFNQAKTKLKSLYGPAWARIYSYANLNPKGKAMQMLKQFQDANESDSNDKSKKIAEWTGRARADFDKLTDAHENEIFDYLSKNDKIKTYSELGELLNRRVNGLEEFNSNEPLNFEQKVGRGSNEVEIVKEIQDLKNRDVQIKKKIKELQSFGKNINDTQRKQIKDLTAESIKINTVDIPNAQKKQKQARAADAEQFDIFSQINEQIENGNITPEQVDEFVNDDRKAEEIDPIVEVIESKAKGYNKAELEEVVAEVDAVLANEENKQSEYKFSNSPSLKNAQAVDSSVLPITPKATENILKNEGTWNKAIIGDVKNLGNGWFEVGKTVKGESILYSPTTDKAVTIVDSENKGGRNAVYVNDFINNNPTILEKQQLKDKANAEIDTDLVSKEYYEKFQKDFPNTLLAIEEKNGLITIFENGETREVEDYEFVKELKNALAKGYKGIGKVTRKVVDTETKKLRANAEVDKIAKKIKDFLPGIDDPDLNKQGISQDDLIDLVASTVKTLVSKGIDINDAIRQVIASIKERFNVDVDENLVKEKLGVEKPQDFESKASKKSVLNRMASGNSSVIKKAISKYSLDYEIENQKEAKLKAEMFVDEVGVDNALIAVRKGLIDGAQGAFIYAKAIEVLEQQINDLKGDDKLDAIADYQELLGQVSDELDNRSRSNGRFIAALAEIYNSSNGRYNLKKMVSDYKAANNGTISKEVLEKLKNVEEKLKVAEAKLAELEAKKRVEEENEAFNNILEAVARKKRINTNAKISDKQKAKAFADKLRSFKISNKANLSAATPFSIAYDLAIETAAKAIEVSGLVSDAIKAGVNSIRNSKLSKDEQEQALSDLFDLFDDSDVNTGQKGMMSIDQEGKLRIPHSLIREKVENGIDNIDDLVSELMTDAQELFPDLDFTERQVRDIVTGYGKISNPTPDEIETQISIMKSLGKIASGLEDANKGQRPLRSGQQRREPTVKERTEMKKLKALLRDLPLADADIKKAYKTALEAIKKRLSNEIEELDEQIANGEKRKGQKSVIEYDQDAKDLKAERDAKKAILDEMVGKPELTEQQKIDRAEKTLQKRLDDLQQKIDNSEIDYAKKAESVTSAKLEEMRKLKKELESQIQKMREDSGLAEARLIDIAKRNASKRLAALKERIANGDFEKRKRKPTPTDVELNKIKSEIAQQKEIFDKEVYKLELKNRKWEQKALDRLKDILSIPKILSFTADLSFVGIQNVTQIYKMGANSLINLAKIGKLKGTFRDSMMKTFKAMASPNFEQKFMQAVKANPNYQLWKDSKLGIVESHYKESAKAEVFQHNAISTLFDILGNYVASKGYEKAGDIIKNYVNIISIFERGQTVFENQMRINRFQEGVDLLKAQGLNPIDDIQEYRKVAAAVNTLTGRANTGSKVASALREANGTLFSSFSNWAAGVNQLNPYWYYTLTPTARKMALTDVAHHIIGAGSMISMAALYALGQDDDDEDKITIETTPTSSDFAVIRSGNLRIDPWAGKKTTVVAFSRLINGGKTDKYGNFKKYGIEYEDEDWIDLPLEYAGNKIAPGPRFAIDRFFKTKKVEYKGQTFREDKYGVDFKESKYLIPLIFENFREVNEEQPNLFGKATMALSWTGLINTNVYGGMKEGFKDMPDDLIEKEYKVKIQKIKDNEKILDSAIEKMTKDYVEKKISKNEIMRKVDSLVNGDAELYSKKIESIVSKVNKEELKTLVNDPFYLGLKKEENPKIQAILYYSKFKDDSGMSYKEKKERDKNLRYIGFDVENQKFKDALQELKDSKNKPVN